jgi:hypothetical protein
MSIRYRWITGIIVLVILVSSALADIPRLISYQGRLTDNSGNPVTDGSYQVRFRVYDAASGGSTLWDNGSVSVTVTNGVFSYVLGGSTVLPNNLFDNSAVRWLGITVGAGTEITPRTQLVAVPYAFHAKNADTASYALAGAGGSSGGWVDGGTNVYLGATGDSVGIGTTDPAAKLEVVAAGNAIVGHSTGNGTVAGVIGGNDGTGWGVMGSTNTGRGVFGTAFNGFGGYFTGAKNYFSQNLGIGTENPEEMLHVDETGSGQDAYLQLESSHASSCGEVGIRFGNHWNTWRLFMDDDSNDELADGGFGLYSDYDAAPAMSFTANTHVGFGHIPRTAYQVTAAGDANAFYADVTGSGIAYHASVATGYGAYMEAPNNYFSGNTGFGTTTPTHRVTVNGALAIQQSGTTKYHVDHYNGGLNICETSVADYRFFIKDGGNVGIGTSNPTAKLTVNGSTHVDGLFHADAFETNAISCANISNEVGIAGAPYSGYAELTTSWAPYATREITVPTAGYILALGCASIYLDHGISGISSGLLACSDDPTSYDGQFQDFYLGTDVDAGGYIVSIPCQHVFYASAAGSYTYYLVAKRGSDNNASIEHQRMDLIFIPTAYSSKDGAMMAAGEDVLSQEPDLSSTDEPETHRRDVATAGTSSTPDVGRIATRVDQLTAELALLKEQLQQAQKK